MMSPEATAHWCSIHQNYYFQLTADQGPALCMDCETEQEHFYFDSMRDLYCCKTCNKEIPSLSAMDGALMKHLKEEILNNESKD